MKIFKDETSPIGYSFEGGFAVLDDDGAVNAALSGDSHFTPETWVKPADLSGNNGFIMKGDTQISIKTVSNGLEFFIYSGGWQDITVSFAIAGFKANE